MYERTVKRILDVAVAALSLVILSPLFLIVSIAIKIDSRGPVFFKQKRAGRGKALFDIYKFRTMSTDAPRDVPTNDLRGAKQYITRVGKVPVSYTHLDVYKRQGPMCAGGDAAAG